MATPAGYVKPGSPRFLARHVIGNRCYLTTNPSLRAFATNTFSLCSPHSFAILPDLMCARRLSTAIFAASIHLGSACGVFALLLLTSACTTLQTSRDSADENLRSRMVAGPRREIFDLVKQCVYREFGGGQVRADANMGEVTATVTDIITGEATLKSTVIERPDDLVEVSVYAHGFGADQQKATIARFLADFDENYEVWIKYRTAERGPID